MSIDRSSHRPSFSAAGLSGSRAISMMRSESRTEEWPASAGSAPPVCAFAAARPPSKAPSLSAITGLPAARAALRVYFTRPGGRKLAHYVERDVTRLFAALSAPIALPSQPATPEANALPGAAGTASARRWHPRSAPINCSAGAVVDALAARTLVKGEPPHPALHEDKARSAAHVQE